MNPEALVNEDLLLQDLLVRSRNATGKTKTEIAQKLGVSFDKVNGWERSYLNTFPKEELLIFIAWHYRISLDKLTATWKLSKATREREKASRKEPKGRRKTYPNCDVFTGGHGRTSRRTI